MSTRLTEIVQTIVKERIPRIISQDSQVIAVFE